jgi:hypothetical protein
MTVERHRRRLIEFSRLLLDVPAPHPEEERMSDDLVERLRAPVRVERNDGILIEAADEIERLRAALRAIRAKNDQMAEDDGLWFGAATAAEAYVQQELRTLCAVIESEAKDE